MMEFYFSVLLVVVCIVNVVYGKAPLDSTVVFARSEGGYYCHRIPTLFRTINGTLLAFAEGRGREGREACDDFSGTDLVMKRSYDNGKTWSLLELFYSNSSSLESNVIGNAAPVQDLQTGRIYLPFCRNNEEIWISYSDDDGITWSLPTYQPQLVESDWKWVGIGPPGGIQVTSTGRLLIPGYHTNKWKGDGSMSHGHTIISDDHGITWSIGNKSFGSPYFTNECQAVELRNNSILINARSLLNYRIQLISNDGGITFNEPYIVQDIVQPFDGCEGSLIRDSTSNKLYFTLPYSHTIIRINMTMYESYDDGLSWQYVTTIDSGASAYSSLQLLPSSMISDVDSNTMGLTNVMVLYERSNQPSLAFEPDEIVFWRVRRPSTYN